jgi:hypothetical protein
LKIFGGVVGIAGKESLKEVKGMARKSFFKVFIILSVGLSILSGCGGGESDHSTTPSTPVPAAPAYVTVTPADSQLTVEWIQSVNATGYEVWFGTENDTGKATKVAEPFTGTSCIITNLTNSTTYYVWVRATNSAGCSDWSSVATGKPVSSVNPPLAPAVVNVTAGDSQLTVTWTAAAGATDYQVWYGTSTDSNKASQFGNDLTELTSTITGLTNGTRYYIWVKAKNEAGVSDFSLVATATPIQLKVNLTITAVDSSSKQNIPDAVAKITGLTSSYSSGGVTYFAGIPANQDYAVTVTSSSYPAVQRTVHVGATDTAEIITMTGYQGAIKGLVNFSGSDSYNVILVEQQKTLNYSSSAYFTFSNLAPGNYHLKFERSGYASVIKEVTVSGAMVDTGALTLDSVLPKGISSYATSVGRSSGGTTGFTLGYPQTLTISYSLRSDYPPFDEVTATVQVNGSTIWSKSNDSDSKKSGTVSVFSNYGGSASIKLSGNDFSYKDCSLTVQYSVDNEAPAISLAKTWCYSSQEVQTSVNCMDSISGIASCGYALTNSLSTPASWTSIPASTAVQVTDAGTWYLHVKATDGAGNSYERIEGPYVITSLAASRMGLKK